MAEGFEYIAEIRDEMSGPADAIKKSLHGLQEAFHATGEAEKKARDSSGRFISSQRSAVEALGHHTEGMAKAKEHLTGFSEQWHKFGESMIPQVAIGELVAEGIKKVGEAAIEAAKAVAEFVIETTKFAVEASEFKEATIGAYEAIQGTAEEGERTYAAIEKLAASMHMPTDKAQDIAKTLMEQGLENVGLVKGAIETISNLERAGLGGAADKFKSVIERSLSAGHFVMPKKLSGIQQESVYGELAKELGKSVAEVKRDMKAGLIATEAGIGALETVVNSSKIAEIARKKFTMADALTDLQNAWRSMLQDIDASPLTDAFRDFVSIFQDGSSSAGDMKDVMTKALNEIIKRVAEGVEGINIFTLRAENFGLRTEIALAPAIHAFKNLYDKSNESQGVMQLLGNVVAEMAFEMIGAANAVGKLVAAYERLPSWAKLGGGKTENAPGSGGRGGADFAPANAEGGRVMSPAPGEVFASVAPGELILPREFMSKMPQFNAPAANGNGGSVVHVDVGGIEMHGVHDMATMRPMLESEIADVFERVKLEMGG